MATLIRRSSLPTLSDFLEDIWEDRDLSMGSQKITMPAVNVKETDDHFKIEVAAPGFDKKDFNINIENNVLTISSEKQIEEKQDNEKISRREYSYGSFQRSFSLPNTVDSDKISANYENGLLKIQVPKREESKAKPPKQIKIS